LVYFIGLLLTVGGCAVPQSPGQGNQFLMKEPQGNRTYHLYLPAGFTSSRQWPLVVTLHGMKPFDSAPAQAREWQSTADKYHMVVVAPVLLNSDLFMEYPLTHISSGVKKDEERIIDVINDVIEHCNIDRKQIFATSWSSGGYLMHYIVNRHPEMFAALCGRGSCFNEKVLNVDTAKQMAQRKFPVMIYYGENDLAGIQKESRRAIEWYRQLDFPVTQAVVPRKGHERVVDLAAKFFVQSGGMTIPKQKVEIEASGAVGMTPFTVNLQANLVGMNYNQYRDYKFSWYIDGKLQDQPQSPGKRMLFITLYATGEHTIVVKVLTPDNQTLEAETKIRVLATLPANK
jgi:predicted esterase